ncbi:MAG: rhomboid family intramembrane serine protease [Bacteroidota bacterium]
MASYGQGSGPYYRPSLFGGFSFFPPVIKALLVSNVAIWLVLSVFLGHFTVAGVPIFAIFSEYLALWPLGTNFWPWQLLTYMFMHGGFWHLFFNMLALWMFGMELENTWGSRKFLIFYLICGLGAGITNLLVAPLVGQAAPTIGASGAVFGVLIAFGMLFPDRPIYLYFLLPVKAKYFIAVYIGLELFYGVTGTADGVAHFAHLGGAVVGFVYLLNDMNLLPFRRWFSALRPVKKDPWRSMQPPHTDARPAKFYDITTGKERREDQEVTQEVVDAILDKISKGGYQSLTEEEKRILFEASKKIH